MATLEAIGKEIFTDLLKVDRLPRAIGAALQSETLDRVFTKGVATDGSNIGEYSIYTMSLGEKTSVKVDLRNTDTLANSLIFEAKNGLVELGYSDNSRTDSSGNTVANNKLIPKLEAQYDKEIFAPTSEELDLIDDLVDDFINGIF